MRIVLLLGAAIGLAATAAAQDDNLVEIVDQTITADGFSFAGTREGPAVVVEVADQAIRAEAFSFAGTREGPPPIVEIVDQTIAAGRFTFRGGGYRDASAGAAIEGLKIGPQPVGGNSMERSILDGIEDPDGQSAGREFADFQEYAKENWSRLSPEAKAKYRIYEKYAKRAQTRGQTDIEPAELQQMNSELRQANGGRGCGG